MYDQFYGFAGRPFQLTPDPHFYFESATHRKALSYLGYGLAQGEGFIVITGDIGAGKTTLVGHLMATIDPARLTAVKIVSTQVEGDDMLRLAAQSFGLAVDGQPKAQILRQIEGYLHDQARSGRRTLLIVDEAQNLPVSAIEELRMLSNFQLGGQSLLQIFLLGQPEFRDLMKSPQLEQLRQRVIATHHLDPMMPSELEPYIVHRLSVVGWQGDPAFTPDAYVALYAATGGVPRRVNALMSRVLLLGAIEQLHVIDADVVHAVVTDMGLDIDAMPEPQAPSALDSVEEPVTPAPMRAFEEPAAPVSEPTVEEPVAAESSQTFDEPIAPAPVRSFDAPASVATAAEERVEEPLPESETETETVHAAEEPYLPAEEDMYETPSVAVLEEIAELRAEIASLRAMQASPALGSTIDPEALKDCFMLIEERLSGLESRAEEQDRALRRVLSLLVDWIERDDRMGDRPELAALSGLPRG